MCMIRRETDNNLRRTTVRKGMLFSHRNVGGNYRSKGDNRILKNIKIMTVPITVWGYSSRLNLRPDEGLREQEYDGKHNTRIKNQDDSGH